MNDMFNNKEIKVNYIFTICNFDVDNHIFMQIL